MTIIGRHPYPFGVLNIGAQESGDELPRLNRSVDNKVILVDLAQRVDSDTVIPQLHREDEIVGRAGRH
jgi:hypothetical protein